jgi:hypothetical protein
MCCVYPYGVNDNVRGLGNISKLTDQDQELVVYSLFHKHDRKYRTRKGRRHKSKAYNDLINAQLSELLSSYNSCSFSSEIRAYIGLGS